MKFLVFITLLLLAMPALAESDEAGVNVMHEGELALLRTVLHADRKAVIKANIMLSDDEAKAFWSVYHAYRMDTNNANDRLDVLILQYTDLYRADKVTDKHALVMLDEFQALQQEVLAIKKKYIKRFQKAVAAKKTARFYQIDFRLDNLEQLGLAQKIPLLE